MQEKCIHIISRSIAKSIGLVKYFPASKCPKGHISERYTSSGSCTSCTQIHSSSAEKKAYDAIYYGENKERISAQTKEYRAENSKELVIKAKKWASDNPEKRRAISNAYKHRRRAIEKSGSSTSDLMAWESSAKKDCYWCGKKSLEKYHVDHYYPLSKGGAHRIDNLVISCPHCNLKKSSKDPIEWAFENGRLL
jgi:5-methylcytosine-specific restriction endonuclease McrA